MNQVQMEHSKVVVSGRRVAGGIKSPVNAKDLHLGGASLA